MDSIQENYDSEVQYGIGFDSFSFSKLIVQGRKVPLLILDGKLVTLPSRFCLYSIEKKNLSFSRANKHLKILARFMSHLSHCSDLRKTDPSLLLASASNDHIEQFLKTGGMRSKEVTRSLLIFDFFTWLEQEEGIKVTVSFKYPFDDLHVNNDQSRSL